MCDSFRSDYENVKSIDEIVASLEISRADYEVALSISEDNNFQLYLKRSSNFSFINNYFSDGLLAWEVNLHIQPVFNKYKAVPYMCVYISQSVKMNVLRQ